MVQIPSRDANQFTTSQEIRRILWKAKVHYGVDKSSLPVPT
jgi:hypothetical protein